MSGGEYEYITYKIEEFARQLRCNSVPQRIAFKELLNLIAVAAHDIEWVDSGDSSPGDELAAIDAVFDFMKCSEKCAYNKAAIGEIKKLIKNIGGD